MNGPERIGLFGVIHADQPDKVTDELDEFAGHVDAIFLEADALTLRELCRIGCRAPLLLVGLYSLFFLSQLPLFVLFNRDIIPTERIAVERVAGDEIAVHTVDDTPLRRLLDAGPAMIAANWLLVGYIAWQSPVATVATAAVVLGGMLGALVLHRRGRRYSAVCLGLTGLAAAAVLFIIGLFSLWLVLTGLFGAYALIYWTIGHRNRVMLDRLAAVSADREYGDVALVTGKAHLGGLARLADERGLTVAAVHTSMWRKPGEMLTEFDPSDLREFGRTTDGGRRYPEVVAGSERGVTRRRIGAACLDLALLPLLALVAYAPVAIAYEGINGIGTGNTSLPIFAGSALLALVCYPTIAESRYGTTVGKHVAGLAVATADGERPSTRQVLVRNLCRPVDALGLYALGSAVMAGTDRHQRIGDLAADTVVASIDPRDRADWRLSRAIYPESEREGLQSRAIAAFIDACLISILTSGLLIAVVFGVGVQQWLTSADGFAYPEEIRIALFLLVSVAYYAILEYRYGTTPGKHICGNRVVVDADGGRLSRRQALVRNLLRPIDALGLYAIGALAMVWTDRTQRLGDVVAGTVVGRRAAPNGTTTDSDRVEDPRPADKERPPIVAPGTEGAIGKRVLAAIVD
ncbi:RDD family protein [Natrinema sp. SYSU A 869]|uniref:RDD family protein n=1 Tax=Natrinema sp. SYSU A 869 TaxID=2871694 RepID=UPI001CA39F4A|nr:RDD family protein [Natrinema sp. SYSU A 869]